MANVNVEDKKNIINSLNGNPKKRIIIEWILGIVIMALIAGVKIYVSNLMQSPFIFSDEQSYFGMTQKIANYAFHTIKNSHMPGYPLLVAPLFAYAETSVEAYHMMLIFNSVIGTISYALVFYLCRSVWKIKGSSSILVAIATSLSSGFYAYNYIIMSETIQTLFYLIFFVLFCDVIWNKRRAKSAVWFIMGFVLGFLPIIKTQAIIMLVLFIGCVILYQMSEGKWINKVGLRISGVVAIAIFLIFRFVLFKNVGLYEGQSTDNLQSLFTIFESGTNFWSLVRISFAEFAYFFVATGLIPVYFVLIYGVKFEKKIIKSREGLFLSLFAVATLLGNIALTIIHAYHVYTEQNNPTVYARYLDCFQPIFVAVGLSLLFQYKHSNLKLSKKVLSVITILVSILVLLIYPSVNKIEANTLSVRLFNDFPTVGFIVIFVCALLICGFILLKSKGLSIAYVFLIVLFCLMDYKCVSVQLTKGEEMAQVLNAAHYFADNPIEGEMVVLDTDVFGEAMTEDYSSGSATSDMYVDKIMELNFKYTVMFWALKNNTVLQQAISKEDEMYVYTNKLLTRDVLSSSGSWILYDKENQEDYAVDIEHIFVTSEGNLEFASPELLRVTGNTVTTRLYINDVNEFTIRFNFSDNIIILPGEDEIQCSVNGIPLEFIAEEEAANYMTFHYQGQEPITVESLSIEYSGKYNELIEEGILYIKSMEIQY